MKTYTRADLQRMKPKIQASGFDDLQISQFLRICFWGYFNNTRFSRFLHGIDTGMSAVKAYEYAKQF